MTERRPSARPKPVRVLVVDDDANSRELVDQLLTDAGFEVVTAGDGVEALEVAAATTVQIAIVDLSMPRMGGVDLCRRLRDRPGPGEMRILVLSAVDVLSEQLRALKAGADDFMGKPLDEAVLLRKVRGFADLIEMHEQLGKISKR